MALCSVTVDFDKQTFWAVIDDGVVEICKKDGAALRYTLEIGLLSQDAFSRRIAELDQDKAGSGLGANPQEAKVAGESDAGEAGT